MTTRRILYLVNESRFFLSHRLPLALAAQAAGYEVHIATPADDAAHLIPRHGLRHHPVALSREGTGPLGELRGLVSIGRLYRRLRPDLVHQVTIKPVLYGGLMGRLLGVPARVSAISGLGYLFIAPGLKACLLRTAARQAYRGALGGAGSQVIFQNPDDRDDFVRRALVTAEQTVLIRGSGVDTALFQPNAPPAGTPLVVLPARMLWDKGVGEFVEAARQLRARGLDARFALVGPVDPYNPAGIPPDRLEAWQREGVIEWWGRRDDMPQVLRQATVVCLPSYREGLPKALLEAAASGRAIVTTDVPGCREVVREGHNGLLVPARDAEALARALEALLGDAERCRAMGGCGRQLVEQELSLQRVIDDHLRLYRELLA